MDHPVRQTAAMMAVVIAFPLFLSWLLIRLFASVWRKTGGFTYILVQNTKIIAKEHFEKLTSLIKALELEDEITLPVEVKHFFSGAAVYVDGVLCASCSPVGLAFKLPDREVTQLISKGQAKPLQYFPEGHIKKGYALFENPGDKKPGHWKKYFLKAAGQTQ